MKPGGIIAIHDITLYGQLRAQPNILNASFYEAAGRQHPLTCGLLLAAMRGEKYFPKSLGGRLFFPNIGAVRLAEDAKDHVFSAFMLLTLPWAQHLDVSQQEKVRDLFSRHYSADLVAVFDAALAFNRQYRSELANAKRAKENV
jgi:hypothetical protein